jgi:putative DNA primase/helicase
VTAPALPSDRLRDVLDRLKGVKRAASGYAAQCPAHADRSPSLSVKEGRDGRVVLHCHAGCAADAVVRALGLDMADLFPPRDDRRDDATPYKPTRPVLVKTYDYVDEHGALLYQVCRFDPKGFRQRRPDPEQPGEWIYSLGEARRVLYRLPDVLEAVALGRRVFVVEGEKDADALASAGYCATTCAMGAGKWTEDYAGPLAGALVTVLPDNDDPGRAHAETIAVSLTASGAKVQVVRLPDLPLKGDVSDWLDAGHDFDALDALVSDTPLWAPPGPPKTRWRLDELWADDTIMRPPPAVVPRLAWAGRSTLFAAAEKLGKSTLLGLAAAAVSRGVPFLDEPANNGRPGAVLLVGLEEYLGDAARRLQHFEADATRVHIVDRLPADPRERPQALRAHIDAVHPALVVIDSLIAYSEGAITDSGNSAQAGPIVQALTRLAHETGIALVIVHHARKADGRYRDSSAIGGAVDLIVEMFAPEEDTDPTLRQFRSRGRVPTTNYALRFDGDTYTLVSGASAPIDQRIVEYVRATGPVSLNMVRRQIGGRAADVDATLTRLAQAGRIIDDPDPRTGFHQYRTPLHGATIPPSNGGYL